MTQITLRPARPDEMDFALDVKRASFREYAEKAWGWDEADQRARHRERWSSQDYQVIRFEGEDVGIFVIARHADHLKVNQLYILPPYQGKGIGAACMRRVMAKAGLPVRLQALAVNPRAITFYERLGFHEYERDDIHIQMERLPTSSTSCKESETPCL